MKKLCVITGTRAEYGLLKSIIEKISKDNELELFLVVTGMHLSPEFGLTYKEIEEDGYNINAKNEMLLSSDTPNGITKSIGLGVIGFADIFTQSKVDMVILLGDRYEAFAAATAAMVHRIPIAHIHGGELTEGVIDEAIRHAITKMSMLHFTSTNIYRRRIIQLGEQPEYVFDVGALGVENIKNLNLLSKELLEKEMHFKFEGKVIMVTYHPVTLEKQSAASQFEGLLRALSRIDNINIIFTKANADTDGRVINILIDKYVSENRNTSIAYYSLGQIKYLSALKYCDAVVGNSSSGIIEAPSLGTPTVNIGDRQRGRVQAKSIVNCVTKEYEIENSIKKVLSDEFKQKIMDNQNPYDKENTSELIINHIKKYLSNNVDMKKIFYDIKE